MDVFDLVPPLWDRNFTAFDEDLGIASPVEPHVAPLVKVSHSLPSEHIHNVNNASTLIVCSTNSVSDIALSSIQSSSALDSTLCALMMIPSSSSQCTFNVTSPTNTSCWTLHSVLSSHGDSFLMLCCKQLLSPESVQEAVLHFMHSTCPSVSKYGLSYG
jgi:hypothetical protein